MAGSLPSGEEKGSVPVHADPVWIAVHVALLEIFVGGAVWHPV